MDLWVNSDELLVHGRAPDHACGISVYGVALSVVQLRSGAVMASIRVVAGMVTA